MAKKTSASFQKVCLHPGKETFIYNGKASASVYLLANHRERQTHKGTWQVLGVHLIGYSFQVILLPRVLLNLQHRLGDKTDTFIPLQITDIIYIYNIQTMFTTSLIAELNPVSTDGRVLASLPWWRTSWRKGWPAWWRDPEPGSSGQWSRASAPQGKWHHLPPSSSNLGYSKGEPKGR